jgi:thiol-disulfide isomerase/thioredoxin
MSKPLTLITAILLLSFSIFGQEAATSDSLPENIMNKNIQSLDGKSFRLAESRGKVSIILLWASWCGPCWFAAKDLNKVRGDYDNRNVEIIGLTAENSREDRKSVRKFVRTNKIGFKIGWIDEQTAVSLAATPAVIPQIMVITNDGHVVKRFLGYNPMPQKTLAELNAVVNQYLIKQSGTER